jgi:hypothetical protein
MIIIFLYQKARWKNVYFCIYIFLKKLSNSLRRAAYMAGHTIFYVRMKYNYKILRYILSEK